MSSGMAAKSIDKDEVKAAAAGRCAEIVATVCGIDAAILDGKNRPCPKCGGVDRFAVFSDFDTTGSCICRKCHDKKNVDVFATVQWLCDCSFPEAVSLVATYLGIQPTNAKPTPKKPVAQNSD